MFSRTGANLAFKAAKTCLSLVTVSLTVTLQQMVGAGPACAQSLSMRTPVKSCGQIGTLWAPYSEGTVNLAQQNLDKVKAYVDGVYAGQQFENTMGFEIIGALYFWNYAFCGSDVHKEQNTGPYDLNNKAYVTGSDTPVAEDTENWTPGP